MKKPFHILAYGVNGGVNDANVDMTASTDPSFSQRNSHYIFSEDYELIGWYGSGASLTDMRLDVPTINAIGIHRLWGVNRSATVPAVPVWEDLRKYPVALPFNEELAVRESNNLGVGNERENAFLFIQPRGRDFTLPPGLRRIKARFTATATAVANAWSGFASITMEQALRGGWYSVVGAEMFEANTLAFSLNFPRMPLINGRKLFPGNVCSQARGNYPLHPDPSFMGWWGTFHSFELPQISIWANAAGAGEVGYLDLIYHGDTAPPELIAGGIPYPGSTAGMGGMQY